MLSYVCSNDHHYKDDTNEEEKNAHLESVNGE